MNRRSFLKMLGWAGPVAAVAPTYFFAPKGGWVSSESGLWIRPNNANFFLDGQELVVYGKCGGLAKNTITIDSIDTVTNTIRFKSPVNVEVGDLLLMNIKKGSSVLDHIVEVG